MDDVKRRKKIAARIAKRRIGMCITQAELARRSGLTASAVNHYERGKRTPESVSAIALAKALGVSLEYVLGQ